MFNRRKFSGASKNYFPDVGTLFVDPRRVSATLTNWSAETFPWALVNFDFLHWLYSIVVSGIEKFPEFYKILFDRYQINPAQAIFIDENIKNVKGALTVGLPTIHFQNSQQVRKELTKLEIL